MSVAIEHLQDAPPPAAGAPGAVLEWRFDPWREHRGRALGAAAAVLGIAGLIAAARLAALTSLVLTSAGALALMPAYAVCRCRVDAAGVHRRLGLLPWDHRSWDQVRAARLGLAALVVSPSQRGGTLARLRSLVLPLPADADVGLRADLERRIATHGF